VRICPQPEPQRLQGAVTTVDRSTIVTENLYLWSGDPASQQVIWSRTTIEGAFIR
ncbi:MAG: hypothetical protein ACI9OU_001431, partial [Candidatus Promineifilaceae bacterium]